MYAALFASGYVNTWHMDVLSSIRNMMINDQWSSDVVVKQVPSKGETYWKMIWATNQPTIQINLDTVIELTHLEDQG